jgi:site-specific DNA-methyltransferase (adenine-specific)
MTPPPPLPATIAAILEEILSYLAHAVRQERRSIEFYLKAGELWLAIKDDPRLPRGGIAALAPFLRPHTVPFVNECALAFDGHRTGDLATGERWVEVHCHRLRNIYEPYRSAEIIRVYRAWRDKKQIHQIGRRLPLAMTAEKLFVRRRHETFAGYGSIVLGDCHELIRDVPEGTVDANIFDPPYGIAVTNGWSASPGKIQHHNSQWDVPLGWHVLFPQLWRVQKLTGTIVIASMEPLTSELIHAERKSYLYSWYWLRRPGNPYGPKYGRPLNVIEEIPVFSQAGHEERTYNPPTIPLEQPYARLLPLPFSDQFAAQRVMVYEKQSTNLLYAEQSEYDNKGSTTIQWGVKPVNLMRQLVRIHSNPGDLILDVAGGSMTTAVACILEDRQFLCFEKHKPHFVLGVRRVRDLLNSITKNAAD